MRAEWIIVCLLLAGCASAPPASASGECSSGTAPRALAVTSGGGFVPDGSLPLARVVDRDGTYREVRAHTEQGSGTSSGELQGITEREAVAVIEDLGLDVRGKKVVIDHARAVRHTQAEFDEFCANLAGLRGLDAEYKEDVRCVDGGGQTWSASTSNWTKRVAVHDCARGSEAIQPFAQGLAAYGKT